MPPCPPHRLSPQPPTRAAESLTIPVIAARAGVHATTVYRRWGSVPELLSDIATSRFSGDVVVPDTGSLRGDLDRWVGQVATDPADPDVLKLMRAAVGTGPLGCDACVADRHAQLTAIPERERSLGGAPTEDRGRRRPAAQPALPPRRRHRPPRRPRLGPHTGRRPPDSGLLPIRATRAEYDVDLTA
ncbi:hypothetical protein [Streptomyces mayteni]